MNRIMRGLAASLAVCAFSLHATPAQAIEGGSFGMSFGATQLGQASSSLDFRGQPWGPYTESQFSLIGRGQALGPNQTYMLDTAGLSYALGGRYGFLRGGLSAEFTWLRQVLIDSSTNKLRMHNGGGFVIEPYVGFILPFLSTDFSEVDLTLYWPVYKPDPQDGFTPRLMLGFYLGGFEKLAEKVLGSDNDESEEEEEAMPSEEPSAPEPEQKEKVEAPKPPAAKPAPKPTAPAKPKPQPQKRK